MAVIAGRVALVKVCATEGGSYVTVGLTNKVTAKNFMSPEMMETTSMGDTSDRSATSGFKKPTLDFSGSYDPADTGQALLIAAESTGTIWCEYLPNGTAGWKFNATVKFDADHAAGSGAATFSCSMANANGVAPTTV